MSPTQLAWARFRRDRAAVAGLWVVAVFVAVAVLAPLLVRVLG
ncbi:MAG: ABC transporter permease, partial [Actinomycetota bacterium]